MMANLAKESTIELAGGDLKSMLGTLGQNAAKEEIPPEMMDMLSQLPNWVDQRASALERIKLAYDQDPRMKISPQQARGRALFNNPNIHNVGYSLAAGAQAEDLQNEYLRKSKIDRERAILEALDLGTFDKLYSNVQKNLKASKGGSDVPFETKVFGTNVMVTDRRNGVVTVVASDQVPQYQKAFGRYYETLEKQGGYTPTEMSTLAQERALHEIRTGNALMQVLPNQPVAGKVSVPATSDMSANTTLPVNTASTSPDYQALEIAEIDKELARPGVSEKTKAVLTEQKNRLLQQTPPAYAGTPRYNESIKKMDANLGIKSTIPAERRVMTAPQIAENAKEVTKLQESNQNLRNSNFSLNNMENLSLAVDPKTGKLATSQGPASELITKMGGWTNYFAPESILALQAGNNAAFFSSMQGQVRSILPAYGSGTAVSNLDLIVGQLAAGSLDNTLQGRLKIIGASKAMNKAMEIVNESKRKHLANGGSLADFTMPDEALVGLAPIKKLIDGKTYVRYEPITKEEFISRLKAKNPEQFKKASEKEITQEWNDFAIQKGNYDPGKR